MQSLGAYGITFTSFTTEIHPSFYTLIPLLALALLMALLSPFIFRAPRPRLVASGDGAPVGAGQQCPLLLPTQQAMPLESLVGEGPCRGRVPNKVRDVTEFGVSRWNPQGGYRIKPDVHAMLPDVASTTCTSASYSALATCVPREPEI